MPTCFLFRLDILGLGIIIILIILRVTTIRHDEGFNLFLPQVLGHLLGVSSISSFASSGEAKLPLAKEGSGSNSSSSFFQSDLNVDTSSPLNSMSP
jgi:hypothetical protein